MKRWIGWMVVTAAVGCGGGQQKPMAQTVDAVKEAAAKEAASKEAAAKDALAKEADSAKAAVAAVAAPPATISITTKAPAAVDLFVLGCDWFYAGHDDKAQALWQKALELDPDFALAKAYSNAFKVGTESMNTVAAVAAAAGSLPEAERTELQALDAFKHNDIAKGDELTAKMVSLAPGDWRAHMRAGGVAIGARKLDDAQAEFKKAADLNPKAFSPVTAQGFVAFFKGDSDGNIAARRAALAIRKEPALQDDLAQALLAAGKVDDAAAAAKDETAMPGAGYEAHGTLGTILAIRGDFAGAAKEVDAAHGMAPDLQTGLILREVVAMYQMTGRKHDAALKTIATMESEANGKNINLYAGAAIDRAMIEEDRGKHAAAAKAIDEALKRTESGMSAAGRASTRNNAHSVGAWVQAGAKKADAAQAMADALKSEVGNTADADKDLAATVAFAQGEAALAKGDAKGAVAILSTCVPEADICRAALATAQEKAGDKAAAAATRDALRAANHTDPFALWVKSRLPAPPKAPKKK
jgi:tetratricopeptide (TPR) repeat protein